MHNYLHSTDRETEKQRGVTVVDVVYLFPAVEGLNSSRGDGHQANDYMII